MFSSYRLMSVVLLSLTVAACGGESKPKSESQVVAKVNGAEITVQQLNFALQRLGPLSEANAKEASRRVLRALVEQEMLVQKAMETKLDRDPQVMQALEFGRRQYLAQTYMQRQAKDAQKPSDGEVKAYYKDHPEIFEQRKIYRLQELTAQMSPEQQADLQKVLQKPQSMQLLSQWLKAQGIPFKAANSTRAAEQMPGEYLKRISKLQNGQIGVLKSTNGVMLVQMLGTQAQAVNEDKARPVIERTLVNQKRTEMADAELKHMHSQYKVSYLGAYADLAKAPDAVAQAPAAPAPFPAPDAVQPEAVKPETPAAADAKPLSNDAISKGITGLK